MAVAKVQALIEYADSAAAKKKQERKQDTIDREVARLSEHLGHVPTSTELLNAARAKSSPLHDHFTWSDSAAGEKYRLIEAQQMLRSVDLVAFLNREKSKRITVRKFVSVDRGKPMRVRNEALAEPDARTRIIATAYNELRSWCRRYADVEELATMRAAIAKAIAKMTS